MSSGNMGFAVFRTGGGAAGAGAGLVETGQTSTYHVFDDGDLEIGIDKAYTVQALGAYAGNTNIEVAHYAAGTISFTAPNIVSDVAAGLVDVDTNDIVVIKGSALNDGVYDVLAGGVAGAFTTVQNTIVNEAAGAYVSLYLRASHSNNCVQDDSTGLMWSRYSSNGERIHVGADGRVRWYAVGHVYTLHPAAADLQMIAASDTLRIVGGAAEVNRYHVGDLLDCAGFANAVNNLPGYYVVSVTVNGADLDIVLDPGNETLINEVAGGARSIGLVCRTIFNYSAGARLGTLSGYSDWRVPNFFELGSLRNMEAPLALPDAVAFPGWSQVEHWTSTTRPNNTANALYVTFNVGQARDTGKVTYYRTGLVRG